MGKLGPELGEAQFLLTDHGKNATLSVHTALGWENAQACAAILTEREITDKRNRIRIKVKRTSGFFTLGVCTGRSPPQLDYRRSFAAFVAWDNEMVSYDITGQLINPYHGSSTTTRGVCVCGVWRVACVADEFCLCVRVFPGVRERGRVRGARRRGHAVLLSQRGGGREDAYRGAAAAVALLLRGQRPGLIGAHPSDQRTVRAEQPRKCLPLRDRPVAVVLPLLPGVEASATLAWTDCRLLFVRINVATTTKRHAGSVGYKYVI